MSEEYAYPHDLNSLQFNTAGMTLRDWFAGQALASMIAKSPFFDKYGEHGRPIDLAQFKLDMAISAYYYADAMMEARKK